MRRNFFLNNSKNRCLAYQADYQCNRPFQWAGWKILKQRILEPTCRLKSAVTSIHGQPATLRNDFLSFF